MRFPWKKVARRSGDRLNAYRSALGVAGCGAIVILTRKQDAMTDLQRVHTYCALCIARCGAIAVVENGRFARLEPDPAHPTGKALCAKGRAAPELVYHPQRLRR